MSVILNNVSQLTTRFVILGLNRSRRDEREFGNYHNRYRGCKDYYLMHGFQYPGCPFTACYMTDLVDDCRSTDERVVEPTREHISRLLEELEFGGFLYDGAPLVICLGNKVYDCLGRLGFRKALLKKSAVDVVIEKVPHHAKRGLTKEGFREAVRVLATRA